VSNNSAPAINAYIDAHHLSSYVTYVVGREPYNPEKMKPHPQSILTALVKLDSEPGEAVLIGDSLTDIEASRRAGVRAIGYANKADKPPAFELAGADAVVLTMADVAEALLSANTNEGEPQPYL
jgi:phosphoglycolate phosphatase-like HAD superfamily hydrolase